MKTQAGCLIALFVAALLCFSTASASNNVTAFKTGPFNVSVDLGGPCDNVNISKPVVSHTLSGQSYTDYAATACGVYFEFVKYDNPIITPDKDYASDVKNSLLSVGADTNSVQTTARQIDGKPGAIGAGYVPKTGLTPYLAAFYVSSDTIGHIAAINNQNEIIYALKTIHITETA